MITVMCEKSKHGGSYSQLFTHTGSGGYIFHSVASVNERKESAVPNVLSTNPLESIDF